MEKIFRRHKKMGKKVDGFVRSLLLTAGFYFYFRGAIENRIIAIGLAMLCGILVSKLFRKFFAHFLELKCFRKYRFRRNSSGILMYIACLEQESALEKIKALLDKNYNESYELVLLQEHPSLQLSNGKIFDAWRKHSQCEKLLICTTCKVDPSTRLFAESLSKPRIAILDADMLARLIAENPDGFPAFASHKPRLQPLRRAANILFCRKNAPRCILLAASMFIMYLFTANVFYLIAALLLMFLMLASLHRRRKPAKLF